MSNDEIERELLAVPKKAHACEFGVLGVVCGQRASTTRPRSNGEEHWWVCDPHADFLDRLRANVEEHHDLLDRLG